MLSSWIAVSRFEALPLFTVVCLAASDVGISVSSPAGDNLPAAGCCEDGMSQCTHSLTTISGCPQDALKERLLRVR